MDKGEARQDSGIWLSYPQRYKHRLKQVNTTESRDLCACGRRCCNLIVPYREKEEQLCQLTLGKMVDKVLLAVCPDYRYVPVLSRMLSPQGSYAISDKACYLSKEQNFSPPACYWLTNQQSVVL